MMKRMISMVMVLIGMISIAGGTFMFICGESAVKTNTKEKKGCVKSYEMLDNGSVKLWTGCDGCVDTYVIYDQKWQVQYTEKRWCEH